MQTISPQRDRSGRYEVKLLEPGTWELLVDGKPHSRHRTAGAARAAATEASRLRRVRRSVLRNGALLLASVFAMLFTLSVRTVANPDHERAVAFTARLENAYRAVVSGARRLSDFSGDPDGFAGTTAAGPAAFEIEGGTPGAGDRPRAVVSVLFGEESGTCYTLRWEEEDHPITGVLRSGLPCAASPDLGLPSSYRGAGSSTLAGVVNWAPLLPPARIQVQWFLPLFVTLIAAALWCSIGLSLALLGKRSAPAGPEWG